MQLRRTRIPSHERTRGQRVVGWFGAGWDVLAWTYLFVALIVAISRLVGGRPHPLFQALQAGFPVFMLGVGGALLGAVMSRRWLQALSALLLLVSAWFAISPALGRNPLPYWTADGVGVRIAASNLSVENRRPAAAAIALLRTNADILFVGELTPAFVTAAKTAGFEARYPYRLLDPYHVDDGTAPDPGLGIYSKFPFGDVERYGKKRAPVVRISLPGGVVFRATPVYTTSPTDTARVAPWADDLARLGRLVEANDGPLLLVGDFNASRWQPSFGALLRRGLTDAHEATGKGLSRSWPQRFPVLRLDHALMTHQIVARSVTDIDVPGSDHRALVADLIIERPGPVRSTGATSGPRPPTTNGP